MNAVDIERESYVADLDRASVNGVRLGRELMLSEFADYVELAHKAGVTSLVEHLAAKSLLHNFAQKVALSEASSG